MYLSDLRAIKPPELNIARSTESLFLVSYFIYIAYGFMEKNLKMNTCMLVFISSGFYIFVWTRVNVSEQALFFAGWASFTIGDIRQQEEGGSKIIGRLLWTATGGN